jgi:cell division protein FtsB
MSGPSYVQRLALFGLIAFCILFLLGYASRLAERARLQAEMLAWAGRIDQARQEQAVLGAQLAYVQSDAYIHEQARNELDLVLPGDELVIRIQPTPAPPVALQVEVQPPVTPTTVPIWRQWFELFLPTQAKTGGA